METFFFILAWMVGLGYTVGVSAAAHYHWDRFRIVVALFFWPAFLVAFLVMVAIFKKRGKA